ncbi:glucose 1-dehydrogenase [Streptomyces sp. NPDC005538]|uniref:SDR family NAD(P)-dependent oxidoreductase n=1 Tax=unclassified Streptomyces TaxID=2593676 RepID=UPI00339EF35D
MTQHHAVTNTTTGNPGRRLEGKVAVVTGSSSGIGAATAKSLAAQGAAVVLAARRADRLEKLVAEIEGEGGRAVAQPTDTTSARDLTAMVERAVTEFGHLDWAVNNAGASGRGAFLDLPVEDFDRAVDVNLRGVMLAMRAEIPAMLDNGGGAIVNTASVGGLVGVPGLSAYIASKHGVIGLTKSVGLEFATRNIRVNAVAPGGTNTEMLASGTQQQRDFLAGLSPMKRIAESEEIAAAIVYLLADATFTTGSVLSADGGQAAG